MANEISRLNLDVDDLKNAQISQEMVGFSKSTASQSASDLTALVDKIKASSRSVRKSLSGELLRNNE